jgi:hypothetical protein
METLGNAILPKICYKFFCENCDYGTCKKSSFDDHLISAKHQKNTNGNVLDTSAEQNLPIIFHQNFSCKKCSKKFKNRSGLWKHNQKCNYVNEINISNNIIDFKDVKTLTNIVLEVVKQNKELVEQNNESQKQNQELINKLYELCKNGTHNITHTNSHNKSFNLQFFLNETCKNAMNITDFIDSLQLQLSDLEKVGELGYIEGISNIIIKNLNALDVTERPIHCTDKKRETMYIKDENKWEKEDDNNSKLHKMVRKVSNKNIDLISNFKELHPDWKKSTSKVSDQFNKIIIESMGGAGDNDFEKEEKIIKKVAKAVFVDKSF